MLNDVLHYNNVSQVTTFHYNIKKNTTLSSLKDVGHVYQSKWIAAFICLRNFILYILYLKFIIVVIYMFLVHLINLIN